MITYNNTIEITTKWPAMIVTGTNVTVEQAAAILLRTDLNRTDFTYAGNNRQHRAKLIKLFDFTKQREDENQKDFWERREEIFEKYQILSLNYLYNDRIVSSWFGGPHGWCDWDGTIGCRNYNIGKWPSVEEVAEDWEQIAKAFPFLDLQCQIFSDSYGNEDIVPTLLFIVKDGKVVVEDSDDPIDMLITPEFDIDYLLDQYHEQGISIGQLRRKIKLVYGEPNNE